jgi:tripartite-type tricarboxylate transporter receptor subunit TctC
MKDEMRCAVSALFVASAVHAIAASSADYPARPVRLIVGFPPGGAADILGRIAAQQLTERIGQQVVVDNRGGAGGLIATEIAAKAPADGYTLLFTSIPHVINWFGILAPAGTSKAIVARINKDLNAALALPELKSRLAAQGADIAGGTPEEFGGVIRADFEKWGRVVKESGARVE